MGKRTSHRRLKGQKSGLEDIKPQLGMRKYTYGHNAASELANFGGPLAEASIENRQGAGSGFHPNECLSSASSENKGSNQRPEWSRVISSCNKHTQCHSVSESRREGLAMDDKKGLF